MSVHHRKVKLIQFSLLTTNFECQIQNYTLDPGIAEGERQFTLCPDGSFIEEPEPEGTLELTLFNDWRSGGISDFMWQNKGQEANFTLDLHPDIPDEHVQFTGRVRLAPPPVTGEARTTETTEMSLQLLDIPTYTRVGV